MAMSALIPANHLRMNGHWTTDSMNIASATGANAIDHRTASVISSVRVGTGATMPARVT